MSNEEKRAENEEVKDENVAETATDEQPVEDKELSELEKKEIECKELHDKFVRLYSEFDNFRKRTAREKIEITKTASEKVMKDLLPILDDFQRAVDHNEKLEDINAVKEGFNLIENKLFKSLETQGLKRMASKGEVFDVDKHEAITNVPAPSDDMKGKVFDVIEEGYLLNDKVIRFAKVVVGQ